MSLMDEINNIDLNNLGNASNPIKYGFLAIVFVIIIAAGIYFDTLKQYDQLKQVQEQEIKKKSEFELKADQASKLDLYKNQLDEMQASFDAILRQLPEKTDVESLLVDVSQTALANGLEIKKFKPSEEQKKEFYAELPIALEVTGYYHSLASFISGVAALPRIVTMHDLKLELKTQKKGEEENKDEGKIQMTGTAKTYRYLKEDEQ